MALAAASANTLSKETAMHLSPTARRTISIRVVLATILFVALGFITAGPAAITSASGGNHGPRPTIVLVHGSFADASGFDKVIQRLQALGYDTIAPPNPLRGVPLDSDYIRSFLATIPGPIVLVAHSYGGFVITNAAAGNPNVKALVYVNGFAPAEGETATDILANFPGSMIIPQNLTFRPYPATDPSEAGVEATINANVFREAFAADLDRSTVAAMWAMQRPIDVNSLSQPSGPPAWATIPSWFVIGTQDNTIPPAAHRFMAQRAGAVKTVEIRASHVVMMSHPAAVVRVIVDAARSTT